MSRAGAASHPATVSLNETWNPHAVMHIPVAASTTFFVTPALVLRTLTRLPSNEWVATPTAPLNGTAAASTNFDLPGEVQ